MVPVHRSGEPEEGQHALLGDEKPLDATMETRLAMSTDVS